MKISKSFKIYIHIIFSIFTYQYVCADTDISKNIVIYDKPKPISELKFKDINLQDIDLTNKKGNIMIINFWATWCVPCKREMPSLDKLSKNFPQIKVFPINMEKPSKQKTLNFYKETGVNNLDVYFDPKFNLVKKFKMRGMPTSILINKESMEIGRVVGEIDFYDEEFINILKRYF